MRGKISIFLLLGFVFALCGLVALQAEEQQAQAFYIRETSLKPTGVENFVSGLKELLAQETKHEFPYVINAFGTDDFILYFSVPLEKGTIEDFWKAWQELLVKIGSEQGQKIQKIMEGTTEYQKDGLILSRPDLSYNPENPRLKPEEVNFYRWTFYYFHPGKEREVEALSKEILALYKSKNISDGYDVYEGIMGIEAPVYIVITKAKDAADYYSRIIDIEKSLGEEGKALDEKALPLLRKYEYKQGRFLPNLSYIPKEK